MSRSKNRLIFVLVLVLITAAAAVVVINWERKPREIGDLEARRPSSPIGTPLINLNDKSDDDWVKIQNTRGRFQILAEIAATAEKRGGGLSGRPSLAADQGMLFVFPADTSPGFWMKDMNFGLDLVWLDAEGRVVGLTANVSPASFPELFYSPQPVRYVLEINAGTARRLDLKIGDQLIIS